MARLARSLATLRDQIDAAFPGRNKENDGWIGDEKHQATVSDHNPDAEGVVDAIDITNDPAKGCFSDELARALIASRDPRLKYVISNRRIALGHGPNAWEWQPYTGVSPHDCHVHVSVVADNPLDDDPRPWAAVAMMGKRQVEPAPAPRPGVFQNITATVFGGPDDPNQSAYGGMVDPRKPGVALPFRFSGPRPKVRVSRGGAAIVCEIVDVGPWNVDDPYWQTGSRPQAESGRDTRGRRTNKAGIDLTPAAARALGIDGKGIVDWAFVTVAPADTEQSGPAPATPPAPAKSSIWAALAAALAAMFKKG